MKCFARQMSLRTADCHPIFHDHDAVFVATFIHRDQAASSAFRRLPSPNRKPRTTHCGEWIMTGIKFDFFMEVRRRTLYIEIQVWQRVIASNGRVDLRRRATVYQDVMTCFKLHLIILNIKCVLIMLDFHSLHPLSMSNKYFKIKQMFAHLRRLNMWLFNTSQVGLSVPWLLSDLL